MARHPGLVVTCLGLLGVGCLGSATVERGESEVRSGPELDAALSGHVVDPEEVAGTFDVVANEGAAPEHGRFVFTRGGAAFACPPGATDRAACRSVPFVLTEAADFHARYVILRTSETDSTPFRVYAVAHSAAPNDRWTFHEVTRGGAEPPTSMRRLPCSETMYDEQDAAHACAFYRCRLDGASFAEKRCSYLSDFGLPYCEKYFAVRFHDRDFGPQVRQCLQEAIRDRMETMTCGDLEDAAIRSHVDCYVRAGFCSLSPSDKLRIAREIEPKDLDLELGRTFLRIERACVTGPRP